MKHQLKWFTNRIGKRVYRDEVDCDCKSCYEGTQDGVEVADEQHAHYLYIIQLDLDINYRDKK